MDEREAKILGKDNKYCWFRAKDELLETLVDKNKKILNIGAGVFDYDYATNFRGDAEKLPYTDNEYECIIIADVLEHIKVRTKVLEELYRVLNSNGKLIITVPAGKWLFNDHDRYLKHYLRYNKNEFIEEVTSVGYKVENIRYWNSLLYPFFVIYKLLNNTGKENSDFRVLPKLINNILYRILKLEEKIKLPYGITLIGEFKK